MKKRIQLSILFGLISAILLSMSQFNVLCEDLRHNILRLHIVANSDSTADQELKIKIRDEILAETSDLFLNVTDLETAKTEVENSLEEFEKIANSVIKQNGFNYTAKAYLDEHYFDTRVYDNFTLPAGYYPSLVIKLGKADGKNWWCVVFPTVCIPAAAKGDLTDSVNEKSANIAKQSSQYVMRFKTVEIYEKIKNFIKQ